MSSYGPLIVCGLLIIDSASVRPDAARLREQADKSFAEAMNAEARPAVVQLALARYASYVAEDSIRGTTLTILNTALFAIVFLTP